jgi:hypothetical protein
MLSYPVYIVALKYPQSWANIDSYHLFTTPYKPTVKNIKMRFFDLILVTVTALSVPAYACKCTRGGGLDDPSTTQKCCEEVSGTFQYGEDCQADSISDYLESFAMCWQRQFISLRL